LTTDKNDKWIIFNVGVGSWYIRQRYGPYVRGKDYHSIKFKKVKQPQPAHFMYSNTLPKGLYAVRVKDVGALQIKTTDNEPVLVSVDAYSHDNHLRKSILSKPPDWLKNKGNKREQEGYLRKVVRMLINHPFKYTPVNGADVYFIALDDDKF